MAKKKAMIAVLTVAGTMLTGFTAMADLSSGPVMSQMNPHQKIEGRCQFRGVFSNGGKSKGGTFAVNCRAHLEFEKGDLMDGATRVPHQDEDRLRLVCDGREVYDDGLEVIVREEDDRVVFRGEGEGAPRIVVSDLELGEGERSDAVLTFHRNGFRFRIGGACEFEKEEHHGGPIPQ